MSTTLRADTESHQRNLGVRTYKIIPLTSLTGVIEWVNNTIPFGSFLTDKDKTLGAHSRYNPSDWSHSKCGQALRNAPRERLITVFDDICRNFHPVFRYFFLENFHDPVTWLNCMHNYTRSVAVRFCISHPLVLKSLQVTSMLGFILGIGDRLGNGIFVLL